ncbi:MAG TPA: MFS transporter [Solirubrobacterales bacterium]|nr:MFS transporter [Solirubrobacterales bacterium]
MAIRLYAQLLRKPQIQIAVIAAFVSGLMVGLPLAVVLMVQRETGSFASAGAVSAAVAIAAAVLGPLRGRAVDRRGQGILPGFAILSALALVALVLATESEAPLGALIVLGAMAGAATAPVLPSLRNLWIDLVDDARQLPAAYGLHAVLLEAFFIGGPLIAGGLIAVGSPAFAVLALAACELVGVVSFALMPASRGWRGAPSNAGRAGALASAGVVTLVLIDVPYGAMFGALDVAVPAFATARGAAAAAGPILAALALGSMIGGLAFGARAAGPGDRGRRNLVLLATVTLLIAPAMFAESLAALGVIMAVAGLAVAPLTALFFGLIDDIAPVGTATEAASWITTAYTAGFALGTAGGGVVVDHLGTTEAFAAAAAFALVATAICAVRRRSLPAAA